MVVDWIEILYEIALKQNKLENGKFWNSFHFKCFFENPTPIYYIWNVVHKYLTSFKYRTFYKFLTNVFKVVIYIFHHTRSVYETCISFNDVLITLIVGLERRPSEGKVPLTIEGRMLWWDSQDNVEFYVSESGPAVSPCLCIHQCQLDCV